MFYFYHSNSNLECTRFVTRARKAPVGECDKPDDTPYFYDMNGLYPGHVTTLVLIGCA